MTDRERAIKYRKEARRYKRKYFELKRATERTGHWIIEKWNNKEHYSCSSCQHVVDYEPCYHYCPYCGVKMVGEEE